MKTRHAIGVTVNTRAQRVGYAPGVFDLFHIGHLNLLRSATAFCDYLIAGVVTDEVAKRNKGRRPTVPFEERLEIVRSIRFVDEAVGEAVPHKLEQWERVRFDVIVKGSDWADSERGRRLEADFAPLGVSVAYVPYTPQTSSTILRRKLDREAEGLAPKVSAMSTDTAAPRAY